MSGPGRYTVSAPSSILAGWTMSDPLGYLARSKGREPDPGRTVSHELRTVDGLYVYRDYGDRNYSTLEFVWPNGAVASLGDRLAPEVVARMVAAGVKTDAAADDFLKGEGR